MLLILAVLLLVLFAPLGFVAHALWWVLILALLLAVAHWLGAGRGT